MILFSFGGILPGAREPHTTAPGAEVKATAPTSSRLEPLFVDVTLHRVHLMNNATVLQRGADLLAPMKRISRSLGFRLKIDDLKRKAVGFMRVPSEWLVFDGAAGSAKVKGKAISFSPSDCVVYEGETYLTTKLLERISQVHFDFNPSGLDLAADTDRPLSLREQAYAQAATSNLGLLAGAKDFKLLDTPYRLATAPTFDVEFGGTTSVGAPGGPTRELSLTGSGYGDLLYMAADYQVVADSAGSPRLLAELSRTDRQEHLLGPLQASQFSFGSLDIPETPLVAGPRAGLGASFGNFPVGGTRNRASIDVRGVGPANGEADLFRGDQLLGVQAIQPDGNYDFKRISLDEGPNRFRLVTMTPAGDVDMKEKIYFGARSGPAIGHFEYRVTADRPEASLLGSDQLISPNYYNRDELIGESRLGLAPGIWVESTAASIQDQYGTHGIETFGLQAWQGQALTHLDVAATSDAALALEAGASFQGAGGTFRLDGIRSFGRSVPEQSPLGLATSNSVRLTWDGFAGNAAHRSAFGGGIEQSVNGGIPTSLLFHYGTDTKEFGFWDETVSPLARNAPYGFAEFRKPFESVNSKLDLTYDFSNLSFVRSGILSASRMVAPQYVVSLNCSYNPYLTGVMGVGGTFYRLVGPFAAGLNLNMAGDGLKFGFVLSTAVAANNGSAGFVSPGLAELGRVKVRAFLDRDGTGKFHKGNPPAPNVGIRVLGRGGVAMTRSDGTYVFNNLAPNEAQPVTVDEDSLMDPAWVPETPGVQVIPRAGRVSVVDLPIVETAEIDGAAKGKASVNEMESWTACLRPRNGDELTSSLDDHGGYIFSRVRPGTYTLSLRDADGKEMNSRVVRVEAGKFASGFDLEIAKT